MKKEQDKKNEKNKMRNKISGIKKKKNICRL